MRIIDDMPLQRKLGLLIIAAAAVTLLVSGLIFTVYDFATIRSRAERDLQGVAALLGPQCEVALRFNDTAMAQETLYTLKFRPEIVAAAVYATNGDIIALYQPDPSGGAVPRKPSAQGAGHPAGHVEVSQPVSSGPRANGSIFLRTSLARSQRHIVIDIFIRAAVFAAAFVVALAVSSLLQGKISRPILELAGAARAVTEREDYSQRVTRSSDDEIGQLTDDFNRMLDTIQQREASLRAAKLEMDRLNADLESRVAERTTDLAAANQDIESFSYSVAHDLRAPLRGIDGFTNLLIEDHGAKLEPEARQYLDRICISVRRMSRLIDDMLAFAHIGRQSVIRCLVDTAGLVRDILRDLEPERAGRSVELRVGTLPPCHADATMIRQVWFNLVSNAHKYTGKQPRAVIEIGSREENGEIIYFVKDNGAGFDMAFVDKLFGMFQRLHSQDQFEGTGVGLVIVKRIIDKHGGRVWAEGAPGKGASFHFTVAK